MTSKRDELILLADAWQRYADPDVEDLVDAILDALMEPGEGALEGADIYVEPLAIWTAILTHIKESRDD